MDDELKAAYERLEAAIEDVARTEGAEGVLTEWVVVYASHRYDESGDGLTQVGQLMPGGGDRVPYHRLMGLLDYALTLRRAEITTPDGREGS